MVVTLAATVAAGVVGCSAQGREKGQDASASFSPTAVAPTASSATPTTAATTPAATSGSSLCDTSKLTGSIAAGGGGAAGSIGVTLVLTNTGQAACTLQGWPGVSLVGDGNGTQLGNAATFDRSSAHPTVTLAPGGSAHAPLQIGQAYNYAASACSPKTADGFRVYPPGSRSSLFISDPNVVACTSTSVSLLTVGGLVPA